MEHILSDSASWVTALLASAVFLIFYVYMQLSHMSPGPMGLPYLGYYPFLRKDFYIQLHDMMKKYGEVFCVRCTGQVYVFLGSARAVREAHITKSDCFTQRSAIFSLFRDTFGEGIAFENGDKWKELRKFFVQKLKEFGLGKKTQECLIADLVRKTVDRMKQKNGKNIDAMDLFTNICSKAVFQLLLGGVKVDDDDIKSFTQAYSVVGEAGVGKNMLLTGPLLKYVMLYLKPELRRYRKNLERVVRVITKIVREHEKDFDKNNIRDLVDSYINERREAAQRGDRKSRTFSDKALVNSLVQFIGDGGHSVGLVIAFVLKELCIHPEVQKEIQREIDDIVGRNRFPSWEDRSRMPYTNGAIWESFRTSDFLPTFTSLECTKETTVGDCRVPKGAITLTNFWSTFHDPDVYKDPEKFDPTRFMPNDEQKPRTELPIFFGVGKRSCIGEPLVVMETFLFVTSVLQNFDLHPVKDVASEQPAKKEGTEYSVIFRATPRTS